jgi:hypothetical protein
MISSDGWDMGTSRFAAAQLSTIPEENAWFRRVGFPTLHPSLDPQLPAHGLEGPCHWNAMARNPVTLI